MKDTNDMMSGMIDDAMNVMSLRRLLGKSIIRIIYWVGAILLTVGALILLFWALDEEIPFLVGLAIVLGIAGNVGWRLTCELWILLYYMHEKLTLIDKTLKGK
jgi:hypothetical protein